MRLFGLLVLVAGFLHAQADPAANLDEGFDKPSKKTVVDLGQSPYRPSEHVRNKLTCYYYSTFTVKEYDQGEKGAEWLSIAPSPQAACTRRHREDEKVYTEWSGYFRGVRDTVSFFDAPDGTDGGLPFAAFDVNTGRKLFEDSSILDYYQKTLHIKNAFRITGRAGEIPQLTYFRVVGAGCDLRTEKSDCWNKVRTEFGITQTDKPVCTGYEQADGSRESAIVYPVSVSANGFPTNQSCRRPCFLLADRLGRRLLSKSLLHPLAPPFPSPTPSQISLTSIPLQHLMLIAIDPFFDIQVRELSPANAISCETNTDSKALRQS